ncbi:MAG: S41 family peptidase [Gemmatimonadales bacterium]
MHPSRDRLRADTGFRGAAARLIDEADALDPAEFVVRVYDLLARVGDAHTVVIPYTIQLPEFERRLPIEVGRFDDGYYVVAGSGPATTLVGARLLSVGGVATEEVVRRFAAVLPADNPGWPSRWAHLALTTPGWLRGLGVIATGLGAPVEVTGLAAGGDTVRALVLDGAPSDGERRVSRSPTLVERWLDEEPSENFVRVLPHRRALYVSLASMSDTDGRSFATFDSLWRRAMEEPGIERMVIDLRDNGGGNNMLVEPMRRRIVRSRFNRFGRLYVLIGPVTFSAAQNFATRLERETDALFVGEPTGGRPNHLGDPELLVGAATGGTYLVSTMRWQDSPPYDERPWILPDLPAPPGFGDYLAGVDEALDMALDHQATGPENVDRWVRPWARPSQKAAWRFPWQAGQ